MRNTQYDTPIIGRQTPVRGVSRPAKPSLFKRIINAILGEVSE